MGFLENNFGALFGPTGQMHRACPYFRQEQCYRPRCPASTLQRYRAADLRRPARIMARMHFSWLIEALISRVELLKL